jgi:hypothetical protein
MTAHSTIDWQIPSASRDISGMLSITNRIQRNVMFELRTIENYYRNCREREKERDRDVCVLLRN